MWQNYLSRIHHTYGANVLPPTVLRWNQMLYYFRPILWILYFCFHCMTCTGIIIMLLDFTLPASVNLWMASSQTENGAAWRRKRFPPHSRVKQRFALWFDYTEHSSLKPCCVSESCSVERSSNWNGNKKKIDPCDFVLRVVWGSAFYKELWLGFGVQGGVCVNRQASLGVRILEFGYSRHSLHGNGVQLPWRWLQIKALLKRTTQGLYVLLREKL